MMTEKQRHAYDYITAHYAGKWIPCTKYEKILRAFHVCTTYFEDNVRVEVNRRGFVKVIGLETEADRRPKYAWYYENERLTPAR